MLSPTAVLGQRSVLFCSVRYGVCGAQVLFSGAWLMYDPPDTRRVFVDEETGVVTSGGLRNRYQVIKCRTEISAFLISCMFFASDLNIPHTSHVTSVYEYNRISSMM